jgi:hypothetical protein
MYYSSVVVLLQVQQQQLHTIAPSVIRNDYHHLVTPPILNT